jgi:hypothetical protein
VKPSCLPRERRSKPGLGVLGLAQPSSVLEIVLTKQLDVPDGDERRRQSGQIGAAGGHCAAKNLPSVRLHPQLGVPARPVGGVVPDPMADPVKLALRDGTVVEHGAEHPLGNQLHGRAMFEALQAAFSKKNLMIVPRPVSKKTQTALFGNIAKKSGEMDLILTPTPSETAQGTLLQRSKP